MRHLWVPCLLLIQLGVECMRKDGFRGRCITLNVPLCNGRNVSRIRLPNMFSQEVQYEAGREVHMYFPLVKVKCSAALRDFLCLAYLPPCTTTRWPIGPCRSLCEEAKRGCLPLMQAFGFSWSKKLNCSRFPEKGLCLSKYMEVSAALQEQLERGKEATTKPAMNKTVNGTEGVKLETTKAPALYSTINTTKTGEQGKTKTTQAPAIHAGFCPAYVRDGGKRSASECNGDADCKRNEKCCAMRDTKRCTKACRSPNQPCRPCQGGRRARPEIKKNGCKRCYCRKNCPKRHCKVKCPRGYMRDEKGCKTCFCAPKTCTHDMVCPPCPPGTRPSRVKNCRCLCESACSNITCPKCPKSEHPSPSRLLCQGCKCLPCPYVICTKPCPNGYKRNYWGCDTCTCRGRRN